MISEKIKELETIIDKEIDGYKNIEKLYADKKEILIHGKGSDLYEVDAQIMDTYKSINNTCEARKTLTKSLNIPTFSLTDIINKVRNNDEETAQKLEAKKAEVNALAHKIYELERTNMELIKHGMHITNKTLEIIIRGLKPITNEYNQRGQNITKEQLEMSSIIEEG